MGCSIMYYARVIFETNASATDGHDDDSTARRWIGEEREASPELFRCGQILEDTPDWTVIATCDATG